MKNNKDMAKELLEIRDEYNAKRAVVRKKVRFAIIIAAIIAAVAAVSIPVAAMMTPGTQPVEPGTQPTEPGVAVNVTEVPTVDHLLQQYYSGPFLSAFASGADVHALISGGALKERYIFASVNELPENYYSVKELYIAEKNGEWYGRPDIPNDSLEYRNIECFFPMISDERNTITQSGQGQYQLKKMQVKEKYFFSGSVASEGACIYFVTDYGDYIVFFYGDTNYFMPLDNFRKLAKAVDEYRKEHKDDEGDLSEVMKTFWLFKTGYLYTNRIVKDGRTYGIGIDEALLSEAEQKRRNDEALSGDY